MEMGTNKDLMRGNRFNSLSSKPFTMVPKQAQSKKSGISPPFPAPIPKGYQKNINGKKKWKADGLNNQVESYIFNKIVHYNKTHIHHQYLWDGKETSLFIQTELGTLQTGTHFSEKSHETVHVTNLGILL